MKRASRTTYLLMAVLVAGAFLRLYALSRGDAISDEVLYGFRAIGMLDFDFAVAQPTTLQLFNAAAPWWVHLSFHDHPLLVFLVQHVSMGLVGVNLWGLRLPSSFFGIASIALVYLIAKKLFSEKAGLIAAALMASNVLMVYVARVAVQESQVIFFMLLSVYCFLQAQDERRWYIACGIAFGLGLLSKYTVGFIAVPLCIYLVLYQRSVFRSMWLYLGLFCAFVLSLPFVVYNIFLYRTFGHFDFQLFYIFGQHVPYWTVTPGKDIGSLADRIAGIPVNLWQYGSWLFISVAAGALLWCLARVVSVQSEQKRSLVLLNSSIVVNLILYLAIGPSPRFLTMLIPWLCIAISYLLSAVLDVPIVQKASYAALVILFLFFGWEYAYAYNSAIPYQPIGQEVLSYSRIHWDMHAWGYNDLDEWLSETIRGKYPKLTIPYTYPFLEDVKSKALTAAQAAGESPAAYLFVYNDNMSNLASLWVLNRQALYAAWPIITAEKYLTTLKQEGQEYYVKNGFTDLYFIQNTDAVLPNMPDRITGYGEALELQMRNNGIQPISIKNHAGTEAFRVYHASVTN